MKIVILILAAGSSTRMGTAKQLLVAGNTTLLGVTIESALKSAANKVYCVLGANAQVISRSISKYNVESIFNPHYKSGLSSSIVTGIEHLSNQNFDAVLLVLGDQPLVSSDYLNKIIDTFKNHERKIIVSKYNETIGVPAIVPKIYYKNLLKLKGDKGAKDFLNNRKKAIIQLEKTNLMDIDTKKDYQDYINSTNFK